MNLVIDIGNSFAKIALVDPRGNILEKTTAKAPDQAAIEDLLDGYPAPDGVIISTTRHPDPTLEAYLQDLGKRFIRFDHTTPIPIGNLYATPGTLGTDRLAAAVGAWETAREKGWNGELLIVDFGSAITIDRVSAAGDYLGGNISPGMAMRFEALNRLTDRLPLCSVDPETEGSFPLTGDTTKGAIEGGVVYGIRYEIEGYIDAISGKNGRLHVFFTGRDANFFATQGKKTIFVVRDLVIKGLNSILEYNTKHAYIK